jgi:hypothetical protein
MKREQSATVAVAFEMLSQEAASTGEGFDGSAGNL